MRRTRRNRKTKKRGGDNKNIKMSNRTQFNNFMKAHLSSSNNLSKLANIAAYHSVNDSANHLGHMENNSANMNTRRPATIRAPIERQISPPQGYQGLRNFQNTLLANQRLRRARNSAKQFMKRSNE